MRKLLNEELERLSSDSIKKVDKNPIVLVLDNIRSRHNVGSAFRTADAFLCEKIILCGITAQPPHREIHKTALGATETVDWEYEDNSHLAIEKLKEEGYKIIAIEQADKSISLEKFQINKKEKIALIFGNEVKGVEESIVAKADYVIEIPQFGTKHSINVSVAIGVVVWDFISKKTR